MDPYSQYHDEISSSILSLATLHQSYTRLLSTTPPTQHRTSQPISYALAELRATITALQLDLEELDESVEALEKDREIARRLGLGEGVVRERRRFVDDIGRRVEVSPCVFTEQGWRSSFLELAYPRQAILKTLPATDSVRLCSLIQSNMTR